MANNNVLQPEYINKPTITSTEIFFIKSPKEISGKQALLMIPLTKYFCIKNNIDKLQETVNNKNGVSLRLIDWFVTNYSKKNNIMYNRRNYDNSNLSTSSSLPLPLQQSSSFNDYFNVFNDYKSQLKSFSKKHFDPFCRRLRIHFYYTKDKYIITTVGQLNFFKWAIENNILEFIKTHMVDIENDMNGISTVKLKDDETVDNTNKTDIIIIKPSSNTTVIKNKTKQTITKSSLKKQQPVNDSNIKSNIIPHEKEKKTLRKKRRELSESMSKSIIKHNYPTTITFD